MVLSCCLLQQKRDCEWYWERPEIRRRLFTNDDRQRPHGLDPSIITGYASCKSLKWPCVLLITSNISHAFCNTPGACRCHSNVKAFTGYQMSGTAFSFSCNLGRLICFNHRIHKWSELPALLQILTTFVNARNVTSRVNMWHIEDLTRRVERHIWNKCEFARY